MILKSLHNWSWRTDAFELWFWTRLLRVFWTARRSNQSVLQGIIPEYSLEGLMLKLQYFGHLIQRASSLERPWCWERLKAKERMTTEDEMAGWHHQLNGHEFAQNPGNSQGQGSLVCCSPWGRRELDSTSNWTTATKQNNTRAQTRMRDIRILISRSEAHSNRIKLERLPAIWKTWVPSLGWEDLLETEMATHSSIPAWRIPGTEEPGRLQSLGSQTVRHNRATSLHTTVRTFLMAQR